MTKPNIGILILLLLLFRGYDILGQSYFYKKYGVQDGLPTDIVKSVAEDEEGFFWIATDEGISRYDGLKFNTHTNFLNSHYIKGFLQTSYNELIVYGDLDIFTINSGNHKTSINRICPVSRVETDSSVTYPKNIFEDSNNSLWVSEAQSVVRLQDGNIKRFEFGGHNRTTQFLRSFSVFEDISGSLYVSSYNGNVFKYDPRLEEFSQIKIKFPGNIEFAEVIDGRIVIGAEGGIYVAPLIEDGGFESPYLVQSIESVSYIKKIDANLFFISTRGTTHYLADSTFSKIEALPFSINNVNNVYLSGEKDIWISSNEGLVLLRENLFQTMGPEEVFVEAATFDEHSDMVYYATNANMYCFNERTGKTEMIMEMADGYFQSLVSTEKGIWIANAFQAFLWKDNEIKKSFDFANQRMFVTELSEDKNGNIWLSIPGHANAYEVNENLELIKYPIDLGKEAVINLITSNEKGTYIMCSGKDSYLFYKPIDSNEFENISVPLNFEPTSNLEITDLAFSDSLIYLASSDGLLVYNGQDVNQVDLGEQFTGLPVRSVEQYDQNKLLVSNAFGLLLFDVANEVVDLFNESHGLASRTISSNGIMVDEAGQVWLNTSEGLSYSTGPLRKSSKTKAPKFLEFDLNGETKELSDILAPYGNLLNFRVASVTFPEQDINYQYRLNDSDKWINTGNEISLLHLEPGHYSLNIRARKFGPYTWSDTESIEFSIDKPYWMQLWFLITIFSGIIAMVVVTRLIVKQEGNIEKYRLQIQVNNKTRELQQANEALKHLNEEKNNMLGIVAHDLKSPLSQIIGMADLIKRDFPEEEKQEFAGRIEKAGWNLVEMIDKFLDINKIESGQFELDIRRHNFSEIVEDVVAQSMTRATEKRIEINTEIADGAYIKADAVAVKQVIDNLVSNALKFSDSGKKVEVDVSRNGKYVTCSVKDEGPGLSEEDKKKLFTKFQKLSARPTGGESSSGLGLSIVKRFVTSMGGKIWVESELGKGAGFFVKFPLAK